MRFEHEVLIQIPFHSAPITYESDPSGTLYVKRFLTTSMHYPCHVGLILSDTSAIEALIVTPLPLQRDCRLMARAIGVLAMRKKENDCSKILMVPSDKLTDNYQHVENYSDLHPLFLDQIKHFFTHCEDEQGRNTVVCEGWLDAQEAHMKIRALTENRDEMIA